MYVSLQMKNAGSCLARRDFFPPWEPAALILTSLSLTWDPAYLLTAQPTPHLLTRPINPLGQIETLLYLASHAASALMKVFIIYFAK